MFPRIMNSLQSKHVLVKELKNSAVVTINRPERMNTYTVEMPKQIYCLLKDLENSDKKQVIIRGAGEKAFCAGADLREFSKNPNDSTSLQHGLNIMDLISIYEKPFIAMIDGIIMGSACLFSMSAKYRIATERTVFAMPEARMGFFVNGGGYILPRMKHNLGYYMGLTGARLYGYDMKKFGLATHYIESKRLDELMNSLGDCENESEVEETINKFSVVPTHQDGELDKNLSNISRNFSGISVEEIYDNLRDNNSKWAKQTLNILDQMSPTSLKMCHKLLTMGKELSLREVLKLEYGLAHNINSTSAFEEFQEGVRALIINKNLKPNWNPKTLAEVKDEAIDRLFAPLPADLEFKLLNKELNSNL